MKVRNEQYVTKLKKKKQISYFLSAMVAEGIYFLILFRQNIYPFGDRTMIVWDMDFQYASFYAWFSEVLRGNSTFLFSLNGGLGENMLGLYSYYLSSPLNCILAFFDASSMPMAVFVLMSVKIGVAAAFMSIYLNYKYENSFSIILACFYALCSYSLCFQYNMMWMDCFALLPLVIMGIELFIQSNRPLLYLVTITACIFSNYYIAFMICIFSAIYYMVFFYSEKYMEKRITFLKQCVCHIKFLGLSLVAVALNGVIILPTIYVLRISSSERVVGISDIFDFRLLIDPLKMVQYIYSGAFDSGQGISGSYPMIYAGAFCIFLVILFFLSNYISMREKIAKAVMMIILMIGFACIGPNTFWHGLARPSGCAQRFAFLWVFLILSMSYDMLKAISAVKRRHFIMAFCIQIGSVFFISLNNGFRIALVLNVLFGILIIGAYLIYINNKKNIRYLAFWVAMIVCVIELLYNGIKIHEKQFEDLYVSKDYYDYNMHMYNNFKVLFSDNQDIYRVISKDSLGKSFNKGFEYSFNSLSIYASTEDTRTWEIYETLGLGVIDFESTDEFDQYANRVASDILGVKYVIAPEGGFAGFDECMTIDGISLYKNEDALPILFPVNDNVFDVDKETDLYKRLNLIMNSIGDVSDLEAYTILGIDDGLLKDIPDWKKSKEKRLYLLEDGKCSDQFLAAIQNNEIISNKMQSAKNVTRSLKVKKHSIFAEVNMENEGYLCASLLNDDGWRVYVDGQEVEKTSVLGGMIAFFVERGTHRIEMRFIPQGLREGIGLSLFSLGMLIVFCIIERCRKLKK